MAKRSCALIGPGVGPKVQVGTKHRVSIKGLLEGEAAFGHRFFDDGSKEAFGTPHNGELIFENSCAFIQIGYGGKNRDFVACVLMGA
jgi:hypothetical protein